MTGDLHDEIRLRLRRGQEPEKIVDELKNDQNFCHLSEETLKGFVEALRPEFPAPFVPTFPENPEPIMRPVRSEAPDLPLDLLPRPIADVARDQSRRLCVPVGFFAGPALAAAGAVNGGKIRVKGADGFHLGSNLWAVVSAPSGSMKSGPAGLALRPLELLESNWLVEHLEAMKEHARRVLLWNAEKKTLQKVMEAGGPEATEAAERLAQGEPEAPIRRRILVSDVTPEKTALLLVENQNGLLAWTDELMMRLDSGGKQGREDQHALDLAAYEPSGAFYVDRVGRGSIMIPEPRLSIGGTIQPIPLAEVISRSRFDGWFERPIYLEYLSLPPFVECDAPRDVSAESRYFRAVKRLADVHPQDVGAQQHANGGFWFLPLDPGGKALFRNWINFIEKASRLPVWTGRERLRSWFGKCRSLPLKLALITHLLEDNAGAIPESTLARSIGLCLVLFEHADQVLGQVDAATAEPPALRLADLLRSDEMTTFTAREIKQRDRAGLDPEAVEAGIAELLTRGWLCIEKVNSGSKGRPSTRYHVNPKLHKAIIEGFECSFFKSEFVGLFSSEVTMKYVHAFVGIEETPTIKGIGHSYNIYNIDLPTNSGTQVEHSILKIQPSKPSKIATCEQQLTPEGYPQTWDEV